jgi:hypothetical protein
MFCVSYCLQCDDWLILRLFKDAISIEQLYDVG